MRKTIDEILASYQFFIDVEIQIQGRYRCKTIITGIGSPGNLEDWFTLQDLNFPQQIYVSGLTIPQEFSNNAILDIIGKLRKNDDELFYFEATDYI